MRERTDKWLTGRTLPIILAGAALLWFLFTASMTVLRYRLNYASAYDFGIFSQMYYYMDKLWEPLTTCERDGLLSHFAVHLSPVFYVLLPFYKLVPRPETLLVLQALLVISGMVPLYLLTRAFGFSHIQTLCFGLAYCLYPAFMGGCFSGNRAVQNHDSHGVPPAPGKGGCPGLRGMYRSLRVFL